MKRNVPLEARQKLQPIIEKNQELIRAIDDPQASLHLVEDLRESPFYFIVGLQRGDGKFLVKIKPQSASTTFEVQYEADIDETTNLLAKWFDILNGYKNSRWIHDDYAQKKHEDYFLSEYKIVADDADYAPFDAPKVLYLAEYIEKVKHFIDENADLFDNPQLVEDLTQQCDTLIEELPIKPQNRVMKSIASIYGTIVKAKTSLMKKFMESVWPELKKKAIESGVKKAIEIAGEVIDTAL